MLNLALIGAPGAGKGTQSDLLMEKYHLIYVSTGDLLRREIKENTKIGERVKDIIKQGGLVPDAIIVQLIERTIKENKKRTGFLFDGFPRTYVQAYIFDGLLQRMHTKLSGMIGLEVSDDILRNRLLVRAKKEGRTDDKAEVIETRLKEYYSKTVPVVDYYKDKGIYYSVDGLGSVEDVFERVTDAAEKTVGKTLLNVVIFGYPGAGKGTQAKWIAEKFGLVYISIGKILREESKNNTTIGKQARPYMEKGVIVPDEIVIKVIEDKIKVNPNANGFVFKGFPRTMVQTYIMEGIMLRMKSAISCIVELKVSPLETIRRLAARGKTEKRREYDKTTESIIQRLEEYENKTQPVIEYYRKVKKVTGINGKQDREKISQDISNVIDEVFDRR